MKDLAASVGIKDLNVGVGGKTKDVKSFVFDTLKLPAAAWSGKTKDPSLDSNALMDMIFMLENKLDDPDEEKYLETPLPEEWEMVDPDLSYQDQRLCQHTRGIFLYLSVYSLPLHFQHRLL